jgi:hypothetical protein
MGKKEIIVQELEGVPEEDFDALIGFHTFPQIRKSRRRRASSAG